MYITASSTISHQPTFRNKGFSSELIELPQSSDVFHPDYASFIPTVNRRRMSDVLKMAITCTTDCIEQTGRKQPGAIIVGTSMGCNTFTKRFLDKINASKGGLLSPTSFTLSPHNTIAGQISLLLGNHNYNMTHTQNSLSFEQALIDAIMCIKDGCNTVLVGAADEHEGGLYSMDARLNSNDIHHTFGASFFIISTTKPNTPPSIKLIEVGSFGLMIDPIQSINDFLNSNELSVKDIDLVLYSNSHQNTLLELSKFFKETKLFDIQKISGTYFTNSAFAMHFGVDVLLQKEHAFFGQNIKRVLICNNLISENLGLIFLEK
jgi:hypothetical protein